MFSHQTLTPKFSPMFLLSFHPCFFTKFSTMLLQSFHPCLLQTFHPCFLQSFHSCFFTHLFHPCFFHPSFYNHVFSPMFFFHPCFTKFSPMFFIHLFYKDSPMFFSPIFFTHVFLQSFYTCFFTHVLYKVLTHVVYFHHNLFNFSKFLESLPQHFQFCLSFYNNIFRFCLSFINFQFSPTKFLKLHFQSLSKLLASYLTFLLALEPTTQCSFGKINNVYTNTTHR